MNNLQELPIATALVVDDDDFIIDLLKRQALKLGCDVKSINDGNSLAAAVFSYNPDIIFLDLLMPGIDGVESIDILSKAQCKAKLVLMSGLDKRTIASVKEVALSRHLDVLDTVSKPFQPGQIEKILKPIIEANRQDNSEQPVTSTIVNHAGPAFQYEAEMPLDTLTGEESLKWIRVYPAWKTDADEQLPLHQVLKGGSYQIVRGTTALILSLVYSELQRLPNHGKGIGIKLALDDALLQDSEAPEFLTAMVEFLGFDKQQLVFEMKDTALLDSSDASIYVMSRLKIHGFRLAVITGSESDRVLSEVDKLAIDEILIDMSCDKFISNIRRDQEIEFQLASLVSMVRKSGIIATAINVNNKSQLRLVKNSKFNKICGHMASPTGSLASAVQFVTTKTVSPI